MNPKKLDNNFSVKKAHYAQTALCKKIVAEDHLPKQIKRVAGVDVAYFEDKAIGAVVVLDYISLEALEEQTAIIANKIPYIPTLLSFREIPPAMACIKKLKLQPDVFLVDAQGYAHPYRCGFASHLGLALNRPTVGVAKSRLIGEAMEFEGKVLLVDRDEVVGAAVTTKQGCKSVYVSVGHLTSLETSVKIVLHCSKRRIPEPLLKAHNLAAKTKKDLQKT